MSTEHLFLTCEHAGNLVPERYVPLFVDAHALLQSHRGWDIGALALARGLQKDLGCRLFAHEFTRLLADVNRSPNNKAVFSQITKGLSAEERRGILQEYYYPYRRDVESEIMAAARHSRVLHIAVHSFTPELDGVLRTADIGLLYDPQRPGEAVGARTWQKALQAAVPELRVRRNYPYRGASDGLCTWLRRRLPPENYLGFELEINQGLIGQGVPDRLHFILRQTISELSGSKPKP